MIISEYRVENFNCQNIDTHRCVIYDSEKKNDIVSDNWPGQRSMTHTRTVNKQIYKHTL